MCYHAMLSLFHDLSKLNCAYLGGKVKFKKFPQFLNPSVKCKPRPPCQVSMLFTTLSLLVALWCWVVSSFPRDTFLLKSAIGYIWTYFRAKLGGHMTESVLVSQLQNGLVLEFERSSSDPAQRIRLLLSELLFISSEVSHSLIDFIFYFKTYIFNYFIF